MGKGCRGGFAAIAGELREEFGWKSAGEDFRCVEAGRCRTLMRRKLVPDRQLGRAGLM